MSFLRAREYLALPKEKGTWVIEDLLPVGGLLNIYGRPKSGKSYLALQFANAIANPETLAVLGFPVRTHGLVAYLQVDTPRGVWSLRVDELIRFSQLEDDVFFADAQLTPFPFNIMGDGYGWLESNLRNIAPYPLVIVIDTLREIHAGDENDSSHMRNVVNLLVAACKPAAVITLTHSRKDYGDASDLMDDVRGSSYITGRMDCILKVTDTSITYQSRTVGQARLQVARDPETGLFILNDDFDRAAREIILTTPGMSTMERARTLREKYPKKSLEACRSIIRRIEPKVPGAQIPQSARKITPLEQEVDT